MQDIVPDNVQSRVARSMYQRTSDTAPPGKSIPSRCILTENFLKMQMQPVE